MIYIIRKLKKVGFFMENLDSDVPLPASLSKVGIVYNLKKGIQSSVVDLEAEYDNLTTVYAIRKAIRHLGVSAVLLEADESLPAKLKRAKPDIIFNIAEGSGGRAREAQIPAMLEMLHIPYTGSDATTLGVALDKALTKRLLTTYRVPTPDYVVFSHKKSPVIPKLQYPVIVKPNAEGSSKGISDVSIAASEDELRQLLQTNLADYGEDMLVEQYIGGREFTVGVLGNGDDTRVFEPMEIVYKKTTQGDYCVYSYGVKQKYTEYVRYDCPSTISPRIRSNMKKLARTIYDALGCLDFARMDFRVTPEGKIYFIEINPLPGLAPGYSDFPMLAEFNGVPYEELVGSVLKAACARYGIAL